MRGTPPEQPPTRLEALFDQSPDLINVLDSEGEIIDANPRFCDELGYDKQEVIGRPIWEFDQLVGREDVTSLLSDFSPEERQKFEGRYERADGTALSVEVNLRRMQTDGEDQFLAISRDITDRKQLEKERKKIIDRVTDAIVKVDSDWRFTLVNENAEDLYGMKEEELLGKNFWDVFSVAQGTRFEAEYRKVMETREPTSFVEYFSQLDGWFDIEAYPKDDGGIEFYFVDVTDQQERRRELEEANEFLSTLFDTLPVGVTVTDTDGSITRANDHAEEELGLVRSEITDRTYSDPEWNVFGEDGEEIDPETLPVARVIETGEPVFDCEHGIEDEDGTSRWLTVNAAPITDEDGEVERVISTISDITDLREYQREIEEKNERLEEFASIVSHDLRNPLNVAQGRVKLAREKRDSDDLEAVDQALERMDELITTLLGLAREGDTVTELSEVDLEGVARSSWQNVAVGNGSLTVETDRTVRADETQIKQLFENLMRNSIEHGGESVTVRIGPLEDGFYVEDDGPGLPDTDESVFEPGYTTSSDGTGFGLNIVREVTQAHGWDVSATDGSDGGARFEFTGLEGGDE